MENNLPSCEKEKAYSSHDQDTKLKSDYESGDKGCSTMLVLIIVIIRFLLGISDKTILSIVLPNS